MFYHSTLFFMNLRLLWPRRLSEVERRQLARRSKITQRLLGIEVNRGVWVNTNERMPPIGKLVYVRGGKNPNIAANQYVRAYRWTGEWWNSWSHDDNEVISEWFDDA